jgi:hypothetical protein
LYTIFPSSGATCPIETASGACGFEFPRAKRDYNALELEFRRRFSSGWLANASYVYSKLTGNYAGLQSTDEIRPVGGGFGAAQQFAGDVYRPGGNANRYFDLDEALWDAHGNLGLYGRLPTDRPHVFKLYGSKELRWSSSNVSDIGGFYRIMSGTPITTQVYSTNHILVYVNGRGDMGRTPVFSQTDLLVGHEFRMGEQKRLRFEFNMLNLFNQKTEVYRYDRLNRETDPSAIALGSVDLTKGFDYNALIAKTSDAATVRGALDPRFGLGALFNPGFSGRFGVKFSF